MGRICGYDESSLARFGDFSCKTTAGGGFSDSSFSAHENPPESFLLEEIFKISLKLHQLINDNKWLEWTLRICLYKINIFINIAKGKNANRGRIQRSPVNKSVPNAWVVSRVNKGQFGRKIARYLHFDVEDA